MDVEFKNIKLHMDTLENYYFMNSYTCKQNHRSSLTGIHIKEHNKKF